MTMSLAGPAVGGEEQADLHEQARPRVEDLPTETALAHADPGGGVETGPQTHEGDDID